MARYSNPIARGGDFADPFVLRFNGRYYLYCTNPDARCWSSADLVHWTAEGPTIEPGTFDGLVPFAPEVVYSNGVFYMYSSPSGGGHYVLRSSSPTGPFVRATGNVGHEIDGSVLVDDDGRWYFYWAGHRGIWGCEMPSPTEFGEPVLTGAAMNGWTEGPSVVKHDGRYHMTLTGNHYLSLGYRINAAVSDHPLHGFRDDPLNPVLLCTTKPTLGLGHNSTVLGPDLVSHYVAYHNLNPDRTRDLDIDRVVWNGQSLQVLGPTTTAPVPRMPDAVTTWQSGSAGWEVFKGQLVTADGWGELTGECGTALWSEASVDGVFTSEHNVAAVRRGARWYGVTVGLRDTAWLICFDTSDDTVALVQVDTASQRTIVATPLPNGYEHAAVHCVRLEADGGSLVVFVDGRRQLAAQVQVVGRLGYFTCGGALRLGHTTMTRTVEAAASRAAAKPVPGRFWSALTTTEDAHVETAATPVAYRRLVLGPSDEARYAVDVAQAGAYTVFLTGDLAEGAALEVRLDDATAVTRDVDHAGHVLCVPLQLPVGEHELSVRAARGRSVIDLVTVRQVSSEPATLTLTEPVELAGDRKVVFGNEDLHDCTVDAVVLITPAGSQGHGDVIVRASQLSEGFEGSAVVPEVDFLLGYSVQLHPDRVVLARHDYDERVLVERDATLDLSIPHRVTVCARGSRLTAQVDDSEPMEYDDPLPHLSGGVGVRVSFGSLRVDRITVGP